MFVQFALDYHPFPVSVSDSCGLFMFGIFLGYIRMAIISYLLHYMQSTTHLPIYGLLFLLDFADR